MSNILRVYIVKKIYFGLISPRHPVQVIVPMMFGKLQTLEFVGCSQLGLSSCNLSKESVGMEVASYC